MTRQIRRLALHYGEMCLAMLVGMMLLWPVWMLATAGAGNGHWLRSSEVETLAMATTMALPMAGWMRFRGHGWAPTLEMSCAMYAGFAVALPIYWLGGFGTHGLMVVGHVGMFVLMLVAMLCRWEEYSGCHGHGQGPEGTRSTIAAS